jgi:hypothetical protein
VYVAQQQSGKGFLLVYDLASKKLLDVVKVRMGGWPVLGRRVAVAVVCVLYVSLSASTAPQRYQACPSGSAMHGGVQLALEHVKMHFQLKPCEAAWLRMLLCWNYAAVLYCVALQLPSPVSSMALNKHGDQQSWLLLNCIDKVIRLADVAARPKQLKPVGKDAAEAAVQSAAVSQQSWLFALVKGVGKRAPALCMPAVLRSPTGLNG